MAARHVLLAFCLVLAACSGSGDDDTGGDASDTTIDASSPDVLVSADAVSDEMLMASLPTDVAELYQPGMVLGSIGLPSVSTSTIGDCSIDASPRADAVAAVGLGERFVHLHAIAVDDATAEVDHARSSFECLAPAGVSELTLDAAEAEDAFATVKKTGEGWQVTWAIARGALASIGQIESGGDVPDSFATELVTSVTAGFNQVEALARYEGDPDPLTATQSFVTEHASDCGPVTSTWDVVHTLTPRWQLLTTTPAAERSPGDPLDFDLVYRVLTDATVTVDPAAECRATWDKDVRSIVRRATADDPLALEIADRTRLSSLIGPVQPGLTVVPADAGDEVIDAAMRRTRDGVLAGPPEAGSVAVLTELLSDTSPIVVRGINEGSITFTLSTRANLRAQPNPAGDVEFTPLTEGDHKVIFGIVHDGDTVVSHEEGVVTIPANDVVTSTKGRPMAVFDPGTPPSLVGLCADDAAILAGRWGMSVDVSTTAAPAPAPVRPYLGAAPKNSQPAAPGSPEAETQALFPMKSTCRGVVFEQGLANGRLLLATPGFHLEKIGEDFYRMVADDGGTGGETEG